MLIDVVRCSRSGHVVDNLKCVIAIVSMLASPSAPDVIGSGCCALLCTALRIISSTLLCQCARVGGKLDCIIPDHLRTEKPPSRLK
jgi:hypothetical protein